MTPLDTVLWQCFRHFAHADEANAAIHMAPVRYSPIVFRLAEALTERDVFHDLELDEQSLLLIVSAARGTYPEDPGR